MREASRQTRSNLDCAHRMERQELIQLLSEAMQARPSERLALGVRAGKIKSRLLEVHPFETSADGSAALLQTLAEPVGLRVEALSEDLWLLAGGGDTFFVDGLNPRFWLFHSTANASTVHSLIRRHIVVNPRVDSAWLSASLLQDLEGRRRWIKSSFNADELQPNDSGEVVPRRWRVQVEGETPEDLLALVADSRYAASSSLTAVGTILEQEGVGRAEVAADYQGAFAASGNSFDVVVGALWRTLDRYEAYIRSIEEAFRLGLTTTDENGLSIDGEVALIQFPHQITDLGAFVGNLFSCREPFRLWAVPREVAPGQWEANAVDLHVGQNLRLEITPRWMRVLLSEATCGNTLARLVANLQHRFDARTTVGAAAAA